MDDSKLRKAVSNHKSKKTRQEKWQEQKKMTRKFRPEYFLNKNKKYKDEADNKNKSIRDNNFNFG